MGQSSSDLIKLRADFNGLFGEVLCLSHRETCTDENGNPVVVREGMCVLAYDEDQALRWRPADVFLPADRNLRARETLRSVLAQYMQTPSPHPLAKGADIKDVYFISDDTMIVDTTP